MSVNLRNYLIAVFGLEHVIRSVDAGSWENPSPCEGWSARDVAGHAVAVVANVASRAGVGDPADPFAERPGAFVGDDPLATWYGVRANLLAALDRPGALQREIRSSLGTMTVDDFAGRMVADCLIHTWDIARATGGDERLDPGLVELALADLESRDPEMIRAPQRFRAALPTDLDADAQTRLLRFAGRQP